MQVLVGLGPGAAEFPADVLRVEHRLGIELALAGNLHPPQRAELLLELRFSLSHRHSYFERGEDLEAAALFRSRRACAWSATTYRRYVRLS